MKKIVIVDMSWPINSRTEKFRNSFLKQSFQIITVALNRGQKVGSILNNIYLLESEIGYSKVRKLLSLPRFAWYLYKICQKEKIQIIFASHWDSLLCAIFVKLVLKNYKIKIIYDCLDIPTFSNKFIRKIINIIEKKSLKFVDLTIFASRYFKPLYPKHIKSIVFENYPSLGLLGSEMTVPNWSEKYDIDMLRTKKNISWIGVVRYFDIINNILLAIKDTNVYFFIFGDGPDLEKIKKAVADYELVDRVIFFGRYALGDLRYIYNLSGLVWAAYPTLDFNAVYAVSNKYFECSFFEKKVILSKGTKMAENVGDNSNIILVDEYSPENIRKNIIYNIYKKTDKYCKYELDILWEAKEKELFEAMHLI